MPSLRGASVASDALHYDRHILYDTAISSQNHLHLRSSPMQPNKRNPTALVPLLSTVFGLSYPTITSAAWPTATATRCWSAPSGTYIKARIIRLGHGFYAINGVVTKNSVIHNIQTGTAYIQGASVYMTTADSGKDAEAMWTSQSYSVFDKKTLIGQYDSIGNDKNYADGSIDTEHTSGTLTPVPCSSIGK